MAGRRPLTHDEEVRLLHVARSLPTRDRLLVTAQWQTGLRISSTLSLTVSSVLRNGAVSEMLGVTPRHLKGRRGTTRWIPIMPELRQAIVAHLCHLRQHHELTLDLPLFLSRKSNPNGTARPLSRESARRILSLGFAAAGIEDDGRLGSHSLRKAWARSVYENSGNDLMVLKSALGHRDVTTTQRYLEPDEDRVLAAIRAVDFTCQPSRLEPMPASCFAASGPTQISAA